MLKGLNLRDNFFSNERVAMPAINHGNAGIHIKIFFSGIVIDISALAALQKEEAEAREAKAEMERVAARVATTIAGIKEQIRALAKAVQGAENRQKNYQAEAAPAD